MNLPDLSAQGLGTPILFSYKGHVLLLEVNIYASAFWFEMVLYSLDKRLNL
jgi:hypothetical protein